MNIVLIIPTYHPTPQLIQVVKTSQDQGFKHVIVIDDGNPLNEQHYFTTVESLGVKVLHHAHNLGKGAALKTAFRYLLQQSETIDGVITVDADGQHLISDVIKIFQAMQKHPTSLVLGSRTFDFRHVPWRSRFGNTITQSVFSWITGVRVKDTQTGLRGIPFPLLSWMMKIPYDRYEFEMMMLVQASQKKIIIEEIPITTVYHQDHAISSFKPIQDSFRIYRALLQQPFRFLVVGITSFMLDVLLFTWFSSMIPNPWLYPIVLATVTSRLISGVYNYGMNRWFTFASQKTFRQSFPLYVLLFLSIMGLSAVIVQTVDFFLPIAPWVIKIGVDLMLFVVSFMIQKRWVFKYED